MDTATSILLGTSVLIMLLTIFAVSYKTGVTLTPQSLTKHEKPKYEVRSENLGKYLAYIVGIFIINVIFSLALLRDTSEMEGILILSAINTAVLAWGLLYFVLLVKRREN